MFSESVAQYPTIAVSDGKKKWRKLLVEWKRLGADSMGPKPPALWSIQKRRTSDITTMKGAEKLCRKRIDSTPLHTTSMLSSQKPRKLDHRTTGMFAVAGHTTWIMAAIA